MCEPISASTAAYIGIATAAVSMAAEAVQSKNNAKSIEGQENLKQQQDAQAAGQKASQAAMSARAARAQSTVAASGAGINLGSNSFLGSLQTTTMNEGREESAIAQNLKNDDSSSAVEANSLLAQKGSFNYTGAALDTALAGEDAYMKTYKKTGS